MEIRVLRYFQTVAREGSITRAARVLHVTQPTLSRQLKDLEDELGKKLFHRSNHSIRLTSEGVLLKKRAEEILLMIQKTEDEFLAMGDILSGDIYIGCGETHAMRFVIEVLNDLKTDYPNLHFHIYSGNSEDVVERLDKGLLDFGILIEPVDISKYDYLELPDKDIWGVIMRKDSALASLGAIHKENLLGVPLICSRQAILKRAESNAFLDWFGDLFSQMDVSVTYNLIFNAALMVEQRMGYAIGLDQLIDVYSNSNLCFRPLEPRLESRINLVWKKGGVLSTASQYFLERIEDEVAERIKQNI